MATASEPRPKKLIEFGWGIPNTAYLRTHVRYMERHPFEGLGLRLMGRRPDGGEYPGYHPMTSEKWEVRYFDQVFEDLRHIEFDKVTDNFINFNFSPSKAFDLFNDAHWEASLHNVGIIVDAAKLANCKGFIIDPENYDLPLSKFGAEEAEGFDRTAAELRPPGRQFSSRAIACRTRPCSFSFCRATWISSACLIPMAPSPSWHAGRDRS